MRLVRQPPGSNQCGQACVAMILGVSLQVAIALMGTKGKTRTKNIVGALRFRRVKCKGKLLRDKQGARWFAQRLAILKVTDGVNAHWVLLAGGRIYDPAYGIIDDWPPVEGWRITSYLPVTPKETP